MNSTDILNSEETGWQASDTLLRDAEELLQIRTETLSPFEFWCEVSFLVVSHILLFGSALWFFRVLLYRDYEVNRRYIQVLFAITFSVSASMLELLLATVAEAIHPSVMATAWRFDHLSVVMLAYIVLPAAFLWTFARTVCGRSRYFSGACTCGGLPLVWYLFFQSGRLIGVTGFAISPNALIARVGALGVSVVALLSGFGAVNFPFGSLHSLLTPVTQQQVADVEQRLLRAVDLIADKKRLVMEHRVDEERCNQLSKWCVQGGSRAALPFARRIAARLLDSTVGAVVDAVVASATNSSSTAAAVADRKRLENEVIALEGFAKELFLELNALIDARMSELKAQTFVGRVMNVLAWLCACICTYKVVMCSVNLILRRGRGSAEDPGTRLLNLILVYLQIPLDAVYWVPVLSLVFVGWLAFANTRQFMNRLLAIFRMVSTSVTSNSLALLLSEVMAMYFSACVLLALRFVPRDARDNLLTMLGEVDLSYVHLHFDYVFLLSSMCTLAVFSISSWLEGARPSDAPHRD